MNNGIYADIRCIKKAIESKSMVSSEFIKRSLVYPFSTENLTGYFNQIDFKDKKVLTVTASGDHALNAILYGSKEVSTFDINRYTKYYLDLKKAAVSSLNYAKFLQFLSGAHRLCFNRKIYKKVRDRLDFESQFFWDSLFVDFNGANIRRKLLRANFNEDSTNKECNYYLNEEQYYVLQSKIKDYNIPFMESNILSLSSNLKMAKYDLILLSNINDYIYLLYDKNIFDQYKKLIMNLTNNLNENGSIICAYIYGILENNSTMRPFNNERNRMQLLNSSSFSALYFNSIHECCTKDAVMVYTKGSK